MQSVTGAAETYLTERVRQTVDGEAEVQKVQNKTNAPCLPRRAKRKGVFVCGRRDGNELFYRAALIRPTARDTRSKKGTDNH